MKTCNKLLRMICVIVISVQLPAVAQLNKEASLALIKRVVPQQAADRRYVSKEMYNKYHKLIEAAYE